MDKELEEFTATLARAMKAEFHFMDAADESWMKAAMGVVKKMKIAAVHSESRSKLLGFQDFRLHSGNNKRKVR